MASDTADTFIGSFIDEYAAMTGDELTLGEDAGASERAAPREAFLLADAVARDWIPWALRVWQPDGRGPPLGKTAVTGRDSARAACDALLARLSSERGFVRLVLTPAIAAVDGAATIGHAGAEPEAITAAVLEVAELAGCTLGRAAWLLDDPTYALRSASVTRARLAGPALGPIGERSTARR